VAAAEAMLVIAAFAGASSPLFFLAAGQKRFAALSAGGWRWLLAGCIAGLHGSPLLSPRVIRNQEMRDVVVDRWNDFSRVIVKRGPSFTWGLSDTYKSRRAPVRSPHRRVAGTQIQACADRDVSKLDFLEYDSPASRTSCVPGFGARVGVGRASTW